MLERKSRTGTSKTKRLHSVRIVLDVPVRSLLPSMVDFVPYNRELQSPIPTWSSFSPRAIYRYKARSTTEQDIVQSSSFTPNSPVHLQIYFGKRVGETQHSYTEEISALSHWNGREDCLSAWSEACAVYRLTMWFRLGMCASPGCASVHRRHTCIVIWSSDRSAVPAIYKRVQIGQVASSTWLSLDSMLGKRCFSRHLPSFLPNFT